MLILCDCCKILILGISFKQHDFASFYEGLNFFVHFRYYSIKSNHRWFNYFIKGYDLRVLNASENMSILRTFKCLNTPHISPNVIGRLWTPTTCISYACFYKIMPHNCKQKLGARSFNDFTDEKLKSYKKSCRDEGLYCTLVIYMVWRQVHCTRPWKRSIKVFQEEWQFSVEQRS